MTVKLKRKLLKYSSFLQCAEKYSIKNFYTGCWEWRRGLFPDGYPQVKSKRLSRLLWDEVNPDDKLKSSKELICHICDNPRCVNPNHFFKGTHKENMEDMSRKGRRNGELNPFSHLSWDLVDEIRRLYADGGYTYQSLANKYNIAKSAIGAIIRREAWKRRPNT